MKLVFMGTPDFAVPSLEALAKKHTISSVVTRPDAVRGRGKLPQASPVKVKAEELGILVHEAKRMSKELIDTLRAEAPDLIVVAAYGCILPDELLELAPFGCINVHASLLPKLRGAAPIQRAVLSGDKLAGVSIMRVVTELDAGAYCKQASCEIGDMTSTELMAKLAELGALTLSDAIDEIFAGTAQWIEQDESKVSFAPKITKEEMLLDPVLSAQENVLRAQASMDAAPARFMLGKRSIRAIKARLTDVISLDMGVAKATKQGLYLGCSDGTFELLVVKPDGKKEMEARAYAQGIRGTHTWSVLG